MSAPVALVKSGIYGEAALINTYANVETDRVNVLAHWLLTMNWPSVIPDIRRQYDVLARVVPDVVDGLGYDHEIVVALIDPRIQYRRFTALDVCEGTVNLCAPPTVILRFVATDAQTRIMTHTMVGACLDGTLYPGDPVAQDWQTRAVWMGVGRTALDCIKSGRYESEAK